MSDIDTFLASAAVTRLLTRLPSEGAHVYAVGSGRVRARARLDDPLEVARFLSALGTRLKGARLRVLVAERRRPPTRGGFVELYRLPALDQIVDVVVFGEAGDFATSTSLTLRSAQYRTNRACETDEPAVRLLERARSVLRAPRG